MAASKQVSPATPDPNEAAALATIDARESLGVLTMLSYDTAPARETASEVLGEIKAKRKSLKALAETITKPLHQAHKAALALFKPADELLADAEKQIKSSMAAGLRRAEEAAALALQEAHAAGDAVAMGAVELDAPTGITVRQIPRARIFAPDLVPRELCEPDPAKVLDALLLGAVPGAELYYEDSVTKR